MIGTCLSDSIDIAATSASLPKTRSPFLRCCLYVMTGKTVVSFIEKEIAIVTQCQGVRLVMRRWQVQVVRPEQARAAS